MQTISWEDRDGARWIELEGELDHEVVLDLKEKLNEITDGGEGDVILLMDGVRFIGSLGIGVLLNQHKKLDDAGRKLRLKGIRPAIRTVLDSMNLLTVFHEVED